MTARAPAREDAPEDALLDGRVRLLQPGEGYRVAIDPVIMAAAVPLAASQCALDLGCGVGAAALCLLARQPVAAVAGLEIQPDLARLARANAALNARADAFSVAVGDVLHPPLPNAAGFFDHVMANPPHQRADRARPPRDRGLATANVEGEATLRHWVAAALALVKPRGSLTMVHRADRVDELLAALSGRAGEIVLFPLWPGGDKPAKRVLVRARPGVETPTRLSAGLVLHADDGAFTRRAEAVLRHGKGLEL